jgi:hypothetical protein
MGNFIPCVFTNIFMHNFQDTFRLLYYLPLFFRAKVMLAKYMSLWLLAEGIVILSGLAYNGRDANGVILWNGGANVKLMIYENSTRFQHVSLITYQK